MDATAALLKNGLLDGHRTGVSVRSRGRQAGKAGRQLALSEVFGGFQLLLGHIVIGSAPERTLLQCQALILQLLCPPAQVVALEAVPEAGSGRGDASGA